MALPSMKIGLLVLFAIVVIACIIIKMRSCGSKKPISVADDVSDCSSESDASDTSPTSYDLPSEVGAFMDRQKKYLSQQK